MSEETNESREDRRRKIVERIIADRQALRGEKVPEPELETLVDMTIDLNEIGMLDANSERRCSQE